MPPLSLAIIMCGIALLILGCGSHQERDPSIDGFIDTVVQGDVDFQPYASPAEMVAGSDAIVMGRLVDVAGPVLLDRSSGTDRFLAFRVHVDDVLSGEVSTNDDDDLFVLFWTGGPVSMSEAKRTRPDAPVLLALWDSSEWEPFADLKGFPEGPAYGHYEDGFWFRTPTGDFTGIREAKDFSESRWGPVEDFDALVALLRAAR